MRISKRPQCESGRERETRRAKMAMRCTKEKGCCSHNRYTSKKAVREACRCSPNTARLAPQFRRGRLTHWSAASAHASVQATVTLKEREGKSCTKGIR